MDIESWARCLQHCLERRGGSDGRQLWSAMRRRRHGGEERRFPLNHLSPRHVWERACWDDARPVVTGVWLPPTRPADHALRGKARRSSRGGGKEARRQGGKEARRRQGGSKEARRQGGGKEEARSRQEASGFFLSVCRDALLWQGARRLRHDKERQTAERRLWASRISQTRELLPHLAFPTLPN
ncbi:unnamed protein product [Closterium sp. NIES-53]